MKLRRFLVSSLILNLMFFGLSGILIYRRGGYSYLMSKAPRSHADTKPAKYIDSPEYLGRKDTYAKLQHNDVDLIFVGDSITDFCDWDELLERPVLNRGIAGDTVEGVRNRVGEILQHNPHQLFVMVGINDLFSGKSSDEVLTEYELLINRIRTSLPSSQVFLQSILPVTTAAWKRNSRSGSWLQLMDKILQVNKALSGKADGKQIIYVDLYSKMVAEANQLDPRYTSDGVHLNGEGYIKWRDVILPLCEKRGRPKPREIVNIP